MAWSRIDDSLHSHPKIMRVGNAATGVFVRLISWSGQHLTDGYVPATVARSYGSQRLLQVLVDAKLLDRIDSTSVHDHEMSPGVAQPGFVIHDFLDYNPSRAQVLAERAAKTARQQRWRERKQGDETPPPKPHVDASTDATTNASRDASVDPAPTRPLPDPVTTERERVEGNSGQPPTALSLIPADWQPSQDDVQAVQLSRHAAGRPVLTGAQLADVTRKFVRRQTNDRRQLPADAWGTRWQEWAERERPADTTQPPMLLGLDGGQARWPHEQEQRPSTPEPLQNCPGCERAYRAPEPGLCRDCRADRHDTG